MSKQETADRRQRPARRTGWAWAVATVCGTGFLRPGPGTYGSAVAVVVWVLFAGVVHPSAPVLSSVTVAGALLATFGGIPAATRVGRESGRSDPGFVVIDEVAGQWIALAAFPAGWTYAVLGFVLFRLFDITKPWPVRRLERLPEGTGVVLDDVAAGLLACGTGVLLRRLLHV